MKISGFTFVRNAVKFDYPVVESIRSILPLCDEFVVAVGNSDDATRELISGINDPRIKITDTVWDDNLRVGGQVLALETDKALSAVDPESTWAFYIQADEVIHEQDLPVIRHAMERYRSDDRVDGLLLKYLHFYGSYDYYANSRKWYRNEVRVIRPGRGISSWLDAQGFRKNGEKLRVAPAGATVFHYGWVKPPALQQEKQKNFHRYWHSDLWMKKMVRNTEVYDYSGIDSLARFEGTHPAVMAQRIESRSWTLGFDPKICRSGPLDQALAFIERATGWRVGEYRNFRIIS